MKSLVSEIKSIRICFSSFVDVIPTSETSFLKGFKMIIRYKPFVILTAATVASILATQVFIKILISSLIKIFPSCISSQFKVFLNYI